jgi:hypothetical protein
MSRVNTDIIVDAIGNNIDYFAELVRLVTHGEPPLPMRAAWVITVCLEKHPDWLQPFLPKLIPVLPYCEHPGTRRSILRSLADAKIPVRWEGFLTEHCFSWLLSADEPIANKAFSMQILFNISKRHPDLALELAEAIESQIPAGSPGIRSKGYKILKLIRKYQR